MINWVIYKHEFKINLRLILIWTLIFAALIVLNVSFFDRVREQQESLNALLKAYPPEFLKAFNINNNSFATVEGYFSGRSLSLYLLSFSVLAVYLGANSLGREISSRTITFLASKPLSRLEVYLSKTLAMMSLLFVVDALTCVISYVASHVLTSDKTAKFEFFAMMYLGSWLMQLVFLVVGQFMGIWLNETQAFLLGMGGVFVTWILDILSALPGIEFIRFFTPFHYLNAEYIRLNYALPPTHVAALTVATLIVLIAAAWSFHRRNFEA